MSADQTPNAVVRRLDPGRVTLVCFLLGALALLFLFEPGRYTFYPRCLFHQTTGLFCPGCGSLRAAHQLLHGHLVAAFRLNALFVLSVPAAAWFLTYWLVRPNKTKVDFKFYPALLWTALVAGILFGILRNLPFARAALAP